MTEQEWLNNNDLSLAIYDKKYRDGDETFEEFLDRISAKNNSIKELIREKKFIFGGRILSNRGVTGKTTSLSNCYVLNPPEDNLESIFDCASKMARTFSYGGGVGIDISNLRPKGSKVHNAAKESTGAVSFMDIFSQVTGTISQAGRRGALMISININHPDVEEFVNCKTDLERVKFANISVRVNDDFMKAVENNEDYILHWPCEMTISKKESEALEYNVLTYVETTSGPVYLKKIRAKELFNKLVYNNWDYAEPGMLFWDNISNYNIVANDKDFHYAGTNPCVIGSTLILTKEYGYREIASLQTTTVNVWNGYRWSEVQIKHTGTNQHVNRITFSNGATITCTDYHKFLLKDGRRIPVTELQIGDALPKFNMPVIESDCEDQVDEKYFYSQGFFAGDGYFKRENEPIILLYGKKKELLPYFVSSIIRKDPKEDRISLTIQEYKECYDKEFVPDSSESIKNRLYWLAGLIDSDGSRNSNDGACNIFSVNKNFLNNVSRLLNTLGIHCTINKSKSAGIGLLPTHNENNDYKEYQVQDCYRLLISATNVNKLNKLGLCTHRVDLSCNPNRDASRFIKIVAIEDAGIADNVYCMNEPYNHTFVANGILTGNCAEEPLPAGGACLLGSLNLSEFVLFPFTDKAQMDWDCLEEAVRLSIRALNQVLIEGATLHPLQIQQDSCLNWRQIGLGTMGTADALLKLGIKYGSEESLKALDKIYKQIAIDAVLESLDMAKEFGCYPNCKKDLLPTSPFIKQLELPADVLRDLKKYGLYNSQLLTCAPTGSIGTMLGCSTGVEPQFALRYTRRTQSLEGKDTYFQVNAKIVDDYIAVTHNDNLPDYFVTSADIAPLDRVKVQATLQHWIDASISSTVNLPKEATVEQVADIYMNAWKNGLKGITVYRSGCKREGILVTEMKPVEIPTTKAPKRPKDLPADFYTIMSKGKQYIVLVGLFNDKPYEVFAYESNVKMNIPSHRGVITKKSKMNYTFISEHIQIEKLQLATENVEERAATLYASMLLRHGVEIKYIVKTAKKVNDNITSFSSALCRVLSKYIPSESTGEKCPECGGEVINEGGCCHCKDCGWSRCN